jgi:haloalkane dehalogenase
VFRLEADVACAACNSPSGINHEVRMNGLQLPNSHYIDVGGHTIHYLEAGSGAPIVFIHGNPTSSYVWRNVLGPVSQGTRRQSLALDLLGFGRSSKPDCKYTLALHASIVAGFVERLHLQDVILVAEDWGAPLAVAYAIEHPDNVRGVALMETFLWQLDWKRDFMPCVRAMFRAVRGPMGFVLIQVMNQLTRRMLPRYCPISADALNHYINASPTIRSRRAMREFPQLLPIAGHPRSSAEFFDELVSGVIHASWPLLWVQATPGLVPSKKHVPSLGPLLELACQVPRMEFADFGPGGHFLAEENPERLAEVLTEWITRLR